MVRALAVALLLGGCFFKPDVPGAATDADANVETGEYHRHITLLQPPPLQVFPVNVMLVDDPGLRVHAQAGANIEIRTLSGTPLPCEIVSYVPGTLEAWVLVPDLATTPELDLVYGDAVTSRCAGTNVWMNYIGVWHFGEALSGTAADSTAQHLDATQFGDPPPKPGAGVVGTGLHFDHTDADGPDRLCVNDAQSLDLAMTSFTFEIWVQPEELVGLYDIAVQKGGTSMGSPGFDLELGTNEWSGWVRDAQSNQNNVVLLATATLPIGWTHLAVVVDRKSAIGGYRNGQSGSGETLTVGSVGNSEPLCFGNTQYRTQGFLDEARIMTGTRPREWFLAEYMNLRQRDQFMRIDPELP